MLTTVELLVLVQVASTLVLGLLAYRYERTNCMLHASVKLDLHRVEDALRELGATLGTRESLGPHPYRSALLQPDPDSADRRAPRVLCAPPHGLEVCPQCGHRDVHRHSPTRVTVKYPSGEDCAIGPHLHADCRFCRATWCEKLPEHHEEKSA